MMANVPPLPMTGTQLHAVITELNGEVAAIPAPYDDTGLAARVTQAETDVDAAQARADAAYSLAQQGGGTGAYDDTQVRALIDEVDDKADANAAAIAAFGPTAWADVTGKPASFPPAAHTHAIADTTGLQTALDGKAATTHSHNWSSITGKPTTFAPSAHTHAIADVTGLQTALDGKAAATHAHVIADVSGLQTALDGKQPTTTFKTINGEAITGSGDLAVPAGPPPPVEVVGKLPASPDPNTFYVVTGVLAQ